MSVVKNGLPVPAAKITIRPFSRCLIATPPDVRLGDLGDADRGQDPRVRRRPLEHVLERERVEQRREHPRVVGGRAVHALRRGGHAAVDVPGADDHPDLDAGLLAVDDLPGDLLDHGSSSPNSLSAHQRLARELQQDAVERRRAPAGFATLSSSRTVTRRGRSARSRAPSAPPRSSAWPRSSPCSWIHGCSSRTVSRRRSAC